MFIKNFPTLSRLRYLKKFSISGPTKNFGFSDKLLCIEGGDVSGRPPREKGSQCPFLLKFCLNPAHPWVCHHLESESF